MNRFVLLAMLASLALPACGGSFEEVRSANRAAISLGATPAARDDVHCAKVDDDHRLYVKAAWVDGSAAGAAGAVAGGLPHDVPSGWRIGLGTASAAFAALAVYATTQANAAAQDWAKDCSQ